MFSYCRCVEKDKKREQTWQDHTPLSRVTRWRVQTQYQPEPQKLNVSNSTKASEWICSWALLSVQLHTLSLYPSPSCLAIGSGQFNKTQLSRPNQGYTENVQHVTESISKYCIDCTDLFSLTWKGMLIKWCKTVKHENFHTFYRHCIYCNCECFIRSLYIYVWVIKLMLGETYTMLLI